MKKTTMTKDDASRIQSNKDKKPDSPTAKSGIY